MLMLISFITAAVVGACAGIAVLQDGPGGDRGPADWARRIPLAAMALAIAYSVYALNLMLALVLALLSGAACACILVACACVRRTPD